MEWFVKTLQHYPEIAIFLSLGLGYWVGGKSFKGFSLGAVTGTLLAGILVGQLGITVTGPLKSFAFLMFLFAVGYGIGPQFVRGIAKDGLPQAGFSVVQCVYSLLFPILAAVIAGYDVGSAAGLLAGSQTISAAMGLATDAINRLGLGQEQADALLSGMPVAYAVTYIFGTVGAALVLSQLLPKIMGINLQEACIDYEKKFGMGAEEGAGASWLNYELRAYALKEGCNACGLTLHQFEAKFPDRKVFLEGVRRNGQAILDPGSTFTLAKGDVIAIGGDHQAVLSFFEDDSHYDEVEDKELTEQPLSGVDVYITHKDVDGKTLKDLSAMADTHGVFLLRVKRGLTGTDIPLLPGTQLHRGDVVSIYGPEKDVNRAVKDLGVVDKKGSHSDVATFSLAIVLGALVGAVVINVGVPITLSTAGGALIAGLLFGWARSVRPTFGYIPEPTVWFMNSVGLNIFIAVVGLSAGPNFVAGLKELGISLFLWGVFATTMPLVAGAYTGKYLFKFHPAILFGCCAGSRTTTAALGMINEQAKSNIPSLGYTVTYAVGNTFLTMWGLVLVMILG